MRFLSLFSGIEAASAAWAPLGWECVGVSEIDPFACAVLKHRHPRVPNLGDITKVTEMQVAALGHIDLVVFGSPCQDLSVAGKQKGLSGERSGLFFPAIDIISWCRIWCGTRFALWENVPGAFSSNSGRDFAAVVDALAGLAGTRVPPKGWGTEGCAVGAEAMVEWSTLDAQWFGVAQRRRRVFALADFGDWTRRQPILLEPQGMRGDSAPRREAGQETAGTLASRLGAGGFPGTDESLSGYVQPVAFGGGCSDPIDVATTTTTTRSRFDFESETLIAFNSNAQPDEMRFDPFVSASLTCSQNSAVCTTGRVTHALTAEGADASEDGTGRGTPIVAYAVRTANTSANGHGVAVDVSHTLDRAQGQCVAFQSSQSGVRLDDVHATLDSNNGSRRHNGVLTVACSTKLHNTGSNNAGKIFEERTTCLDANSPPPVLLSALQVRRLTPTECERLQGFPDGHTQIPRGKKTADQCPDGPRYKSLGNSMAVPVMRWIGQRIDLAVLFQE